jgi:ribosomal protein L21
MYAVIQLQGHQYIVAEGHEIQVDQLDENQDKLSCDVLMLFQPDGSICEVGKPHVS